MRDVKHSMYVKCLMENQPTTAHFNVIRSYVHQVFSEHVTKVALSPFDDKRYVLDDGVSTLAHGHYKCKWLDQRCIVGDTHADDLWDMTNVLKQCLIIMPLINPSVNCKADVILHELWLRITFFDILNKCFWFCYYMLSFLLLLFMKLRKGYNLTIYMNSSKHN